MNQLTFFEKIKVLFQLLFSSPIIIGIFAFSLILMIVLFFYARLNKKLIKTAFIGIYVLIIGFAIVKYGHYFLTSFDSFLTLFMANIYFPIVPIYVAIMVISFIIMFITLSSNKSSKFVKIINTVFFTFIQMLFAVFIYVIESNKIDLSSNTNLYSNEQTLTLLELGMGLFVLWMIILLIMFYLKKADKIFKSKKVEEKDDFDEYINDYNEPKKVENVINNTNNDIVKSLVPEANVDDNIVKSLVPETNVNDDSNILLNNFSSNISNVDVNNDVEIEEIPDIEIEDSNTFVSNSSGASNEIPAILGDFKNGFGNINYSGSQEIDSNSQKVDSPVSKTAPTKASDIFSNFDFLDVPNTSVERKNDDVEVLDFD